MTNYQDIGGKITKRVSTQMIDEYENVPTTSHTEIINGKKYVVVSHYVGNKDFKKVLGDLAFRQVLAEMKNSAD